MEGSSVATLASRLKAGCSEDGREINISSTAEAFHEFGKIYQNKCPCQMHFILCAIFFNAAISRQPNNHEFVKSLRNLCFELLRTAGAVEPTADLIAISQKTAAKVKRMREFAEEDLKQLQAAPAVLSSEDRRVWEEERIKFFRKFQNRLNRKYHKTMKDLSNKCKTILGKPPCKYAIIGRGSLSRQTVTPFSSFKYMIALEEGIQQSENYQSVLNYFYWYDTLFRFLLVNLKETVVTSSYISDLNIDDNGFVDTHTLGGISFDENAPRMYCVLRACTECSFRELPKRNNIAPTSVLLQWLKREFAPCDALLNVCYISGPKSVYDRFKIAAKSISENLKNHVTLSSPLSNAEMLSYSSYTDVKHLFYNSTFLKLSAIGGMLSLDSSSFEIVDELKKREIIGSEQAHRLLFNVALALEVRLKTYQSHNCYKNLIGKRNFLFRDRNALKEITELLGERSLADFFTTAQMLHLAYRHAKYGANVSECFTKADSETNISSKFKILKHLNISTVFHAEWSNCPARRKNFTPDKLSIQHTLAEMYLENGQFLQASELFSELCAQPLSNSIKVRAEAGKLFSFCKGEEYLKVLQHAENSFPSVLNWNEASGNTVRLNGCSFDCLQCLAPIDKFLLLSRIFFTTGNCKFHFEYYEDAIAHFQRSIHCLENYRCVSTTTNLLISHYICQNVFHIGRSYYAINQFHEAKQSAFEVLERSLKNNFVEFSLVFDSLALLEKCYAKLSQPASPLLYWVKQGNLMMEYTSASKESIEEFNKLQGRILLCCRCISADKCNHPSNQNMKQICLGLSKLAVNGSPSSPIFLKNDQVLDLSNEKLTSEEAKHIGKNIAKLHAPIEKLILRSNGIKDDGVRAIASVMHNIASLDLSDCGIGCVGAISIGEMIKKSHHKIKELNLSENQFGDEGINWLCDGLCKIEKLDVSHCGITGTGARFIGRSLRDLSSSMKELNLSGNCIGNKGAGYLAVGAHNVDDLILEGCEISEEFAIDMKKCLHGQTTRLHGEEFSSGDDSANSEGD